MQAKLYAANYAQRREETFIRAGGQCENILNGERCPVRAGDWRVTRSKQLQFEQLIIHHVNGDPENPDAVMIATCWACHMRLHRKPGPGRTKASVRKQGYEVIRIPYLMDLLACAGFHTWSTANGRVGWQIGELESSANNHIDALTMALHWLTGEIRDLQSKLDHLQENPTMAVQTSRPTQQEREQDLAIRLQHAEQRRASDQAIRQGLPRCSTIADDTVLLLNTLLDKTAATTKAGHQTRANGSGPTLINSLDIILHTPETKEKEEVKNR